VSHGFSSKGLKKFRPISLSALSAMNSGSGVRVEDAGVKARGILLVRICYHGNMKNDGRGGRDAAETSSVLDFSDPAGL
jgi:hypothetical protein